MAEYIKNWVEHFFVLPVKWLRVHYQSWKEQRQKCKVCGCRDKFDFTVPEAVWKAVIPPKYQNRVVCLACFDDFAKKNEVDYATSIKTLYFAGNKASIKFKQALTVERPVERQKTDWEELAEECRAFAKRTNLTSEEIEKIKADVRKRLNACGC